MREQFFVFTGNQILWNQALVRWFAYRTIPSLSLSKTRLKKKALSPVRLSVYLRKGDKTMANKEIPYKIYLEESEMPRQWYNVRADMKNKPAPLLNPATLQPMTFEELRPVFCDELVKQELNDTDAYIDIPEEIRKFYKMYRPSPLVRAYCLEEKLQTPAKIYYKFEGNNTSGSHKLNSAVAQAYYAKMQGITSLTEGRYHGNRSRTVGHRAFHGLFLFRAGLPGIYGKGIL